MKTLPFISTGIALLLIAAAPVSGAGEKVFRAGASVVDITPTNYPVIVNAYFTERLATKTVDRLHVRALALDDGTTQLVLAVVDTCMAPRDLLDRAKEQASKATGIPTDKMLVSATHTHSAPSAMGCLGSRVDTNYAAFLEPLIAEALIGAVKNLTPARIGWGATNDWTHTFNRSWIRRPDRVFADPFGDVNVRANMHPGYESPDVTGPSGPVDPGLSVLAVQSLDGKPLALLANYSQHYYGSQILSSDYYGRFCSYMASFLGAGTNEFVAMMSQGTSGDLMWMDYGAPAKEIGYDAYAKELAEKAAGVVSHLEFHDWVPLKMAQRTLALNYRVPDEARLAWARKRAANIKGPVPTDQSDIYALEAIYLHDRPSTELKIQALAIGDLGIAALPNEVYAISGLKLKAQSPFKTAFNIELANGAEGYIPPPEQHKLGGYTTWPARTAGLEVQAEPRIVETALSLLEEISGQPRRAMAEPVGAYAKAVLDTKPAAYWRMNESVGPTAHDATGNGHEAKIEDGVALFLPGADPRIGFQPPQPPAPNNFNGDQINRAVHFAGGRVTATLPQLTDTYSIEFWFWNGLTNNARPVTGYFFSHGQDGDKAAAGDHFGIGGTYVPEFAGKLIFFNGNVRNTVLGGRSDIAWREWHHVVLVREGKRVTVYLNGNTTPEILGEADVTFASGDKSIFVGGRCDNFANFEGKMDEVAIYDRALKPEEVAAHYKASGFPPGRTRTQSPITSPPVSPAESLAKIHVPAGFTADLVAAEPLLESPVAIDWDDRGRLWVVEMVDYPLGVDGKNKPGGRVRVLEDTKGDGHYDKSTIFADGLNFPTGIMTWRDGILVTAAPDILFLQDTDGDGKADVKKVLITGFSQGNQQLRVNGLRWGLDNWVYCASGSHDSGYGNETKIKSLQTGKEYALGNHDFRFRPDTGELEAETGPSQFGRNPDNWGYWFGEMNSWPIWHYVLQERYISRNPHVAAPDPEHQIVTPKNPPVYPASKQEKRYHTFTDAGHFTSACCATIYRDEQLFGPGPDRHAFTCEPFHNLVQHNIVTDEGVTFTSHRSPDEKTDFFASEDRWCRPVMTRTGPDGALWVVDMYRYIIEHPQWLPEEGRAELLPHYRLGEDRGRIYRVFSGTQPPPKPVQLGQLALAELVNALDSSNGWQRDKAQMMLFWKRDVSVGPQLIRMARESKNPMARLHALCTLDGLGLLEPDLVESALGDAHPAVRINALRLSERRSDSAVIAAAVKLADDEDPKVRLQLACTLGEWNDPIAGKALGRLAVADHADKFMVAAIMSSALPHSLALVDAAVTAGGSALASLAEPLATLALATGQRSSLARLLEPTLTSANGRYTDAQMDAFSEFLDRLVRRKTALPELTKEDDKLTTVLRKTHDIFEFARTAGTLSAAGLMARDPDHRAEAVTALTAMITPQTPREIQMAAIHDLAVTGEAKVPELLLTAWPGFGAETRLAVLDELLGRESWAFELATRLESGQIGVSTLDASRRARLLRHPSARVQEVAKKALKAVSTRAKVVEDFQPALALNGDSKRGYAVFGRLCVSCHKLAGLGHEVGPNLQSVANHPSEKLLVSILDPNASIEPGYVAYSCKLTDDEDLYGIIEAETGNSLVFKMAEGKTRTLLRSDITSLRSSNLSLMPEGLEAGLSKQDLADLIRFLQSPSRP